MHEPRIHVMEKEALYGHAALKATFPLQVKEEGLHTSL